MKSLWRFLNTPIIVALLAIALVFGLLRFSLRQFAGAFDDITTAHRIDALGRLQLLSFAEANVDDKVRQKFVGEFKNNSEYIVRDIRGTVCFFDKNGTLIDVISERIQGIGSLRPGDSAKFFIERPGDYNGNRPPPVRGEGIKTTLVFVDVIAERVDK